MMSETDDLPTKPEDPKEAGWETKAARGALQAAGGVPVAGGIFSAIASYWSERDQEKINNFFRAGRPH